MQISLGLETEYGLYIEGRGAQTQIDDAMALVRSYPHQRFFGWDYQYEHPRRDLRGFTVERLAQDPDDAQFDRATQTTPLENLRADSVLANGARLYNDHGHPEYATPECRTLRDLVLSDLSGEFAVREAAASYEQQTGNKVKLYKNNTDFHGASYGTHESYMVPRSVGLENLIHWVLPVLVCRQLVSGAGKVGSESKHPADFQMSQRADFLSEVCSVDTLYRRPIFNLRDEPHASMDWIRLHVIAGDANQMPSNTRRKVALVLAAVWLAQTGEPPPFRLADPVASMHMVARNTSSPARLPLENGSWTDAQAVIATYCDTAQKSLPLSAELYDELNTAREVLGWFRSDPRRFAHHVEWAAKKTVVDEVRCSEDLHPDHPILKSIDLEFSNIDPSESLYHACEMMGTVVPETDEEKRFRTQLYAPQRTRAAVRAHAVAHFKDQLVNACWHSLTFDDGQQTTEVQLLPTVDYQPILELNPDLQTFIKIIKEKNNNA